MATTTSAVVDSDQLERLFQVLTLDKLVPELAGKFGDRMTGIFELLTDDTSRKRYIIEHLILDERDARTFVHVLLHTGQDAAALWLAPQAIDMVDLRRCDPRAGFVSCFSFGETNARDALVRHEWRDTTAGGHYPMEASPRGVCLLVNNYVTRGTYREMQRFRHIFYQLHFDVQMEKNLDAKELVRTLLLLSRREDLRHHNAFVFMIITHGNENKEILGFDGQRVRIELLTEMFDNERCPLLRNKPRVFFFNCCRGIRVDYGLGTAAEQLKQTLSDPIGPVVRSSLPKTNDFLICYSTLDGYVAAVDWNFGTFFGEALADSLVQKVWYKDLNSVLINANNALLSKANEFSVKQPFEWNQCLTKQIFFLPFYPGIKEIV